MVYLLIESMNISPLINLYFGKSGLWRRRISTVWDSKWQSLYWRWALIKPQYICEGVKIQKLYLATLIIVIITSTETADTISSQHVNAAVTDSTHCTYTVCVIHGTLQIWDACLSHFWMVVIVWLTSEYSAISHKTRCHITSPFLPVRITSEAIEVQFSHDLLLHFFDARITIVI